VSGRDRPLSFAEIVTGVSSGRTSNPAFKEAVAAGDQQESAGGGRGDDPPTPVLEPPDQRRFARFKAAVANKGLTRNNDLSL